MAFSYTVDGEAITGHLRIKYGTFTNGTGDTGGDITTGLDYCPTFIAQTNSHIYATAVKQSISGGVVTITTDMGIDGTWIAFGV